MAIFTKQLFDNPYITIGKDNDVCVLCRKEYAAQHPEEFDYRIDDRLKKRLSDQKIFKLFQNSNTPFVLCARHIHEVDALLQEEP